MRPRNDQGGAGRASDLFAKHLRSALNHLYDPTQLRRSPLAVLLGVSNRVDAPSSLQHILADAIAALKPRASEPSQSLSWCIYNLLCSRYIQQLDQKVVANQLGMSERTLRRKQCAALQALADYLWKRFELEERLQKADSLSTLSASAEPGDLGVRGALAWLKDSPLRGPVAPGRVLFAALDLLRPMATERGVHLEVDAAENLPELAVHPVALNQIVLNLLQVAIHHAVSEEVVLSARPLHHSIQIQIRCAKPASLCEPVLNDDAATLDVTRQLVDLCQGTLMLSVADETFNATLILPVFEQQVVLVIDDQSDTLQLLERYVSGTRYRLVGTRDPAQALSLAEEFSPRVIVLDVMMPEADGWSVLGTLRRHPLTGQIPIIVCTILPQKELAVSLGADAFVHKPFTRQAFLAALDHQIGLDHEFETTEPGSD